MAKIEQIDREAAAAIVEDDKLMYMDLSHCEAANFRDGEIDENELLQAFADHRQRGHDEAVQKIVEWLRKTGDDAVIAACYRVAADAIERMDRHND